MYKTLSTKDVNVSERMKMFSQEQNGDNQKSKSTGHSAKKDRLLDQLRSATRERDRLLSEYAELTESHIMPLESLHQMEFKYQEFLQDELTQQKVMKVEIDIQKNVEENRKLESEIEEIKKSRETMVKIQSRRVNEDEQHEVTDRDTTNDANASEAGQSSGDVIGVEEDSLQQMLDDSRNAEAMQDYNKNKQQRTSDNHDFLMSMIQHQENKDAMGKTLYKKHLQEDMSLWDVKDETENIDELTRENKEEKLNKKKEEKEETDKSKGEEQNTSSVINEGEIDTPAHIKHNDKNATDKSKGEEQNTSSVINEGEIDTPAHIKHNDKNESKQKNDESNEVDSLQEMVDDSKNGEAMKIYEQNRQKKPELYDSLRSIIERPENKEAMGKTLYQKHLQGDLSLWDVKEETQMPDEKEEKEFSQDKFQPDTLQRMLISEPNVTALQEENETQSTKRKDFTKSRYDTLEAIIYKPENQAAITQEQIVEQTDDTDCVTPLDLLKRLESEIKVLMKKEAKEQTENENSTTPLELIRRLETELNLQAEREANQTAQFESELKRQQEKYTDLEKRYHKKKNELKHSKTEREELRQQNKALLAKHQNQ